VNELSTRRLTGTAAGPGDLADIRRLHSDPRVMATLSADGNTFGEEQSRAFLNRAAAHWESHGFGLWTLRGRSDGDFVGYGGIRHTEVEGRDEVELAYAIRSECWRKGFATEVSVAALKLGFDVIHLERIVAFTLPHNQASRGAMEHCGFKYQRDFVHAGLPHVLYILEAREFAIGRLDSTS
jgi:RimJ/RimL family protein N-acetyltransferase